MAKYNFYSVIIGTELLNGRRKDKHFDFLNQALREKEFKHCGNFIINDDTVLMQNIFNVIKKDEKSIMFCFGGIGSTPDDYTREIAAKIFTNKPLKTDPKALELIKQEFKDGAFPHRIKMADIPQGAELLENVVNQVPGFYLEDRFFFTPGFPSMAHPMVTWVLDNLFEKEKKRFSCEFKVNCSENDLIDIMHALPKDIELSSLPKIENDKKSVSIFLAHSDKAELEKWCTFFKSKIDKLNKKYINC